ncbi:MAG: biotin carboxyl carrier protein [Deltaproteobacteria bacterium]|nr:biotin carboxyl carrier protein [Deltaproteobacteria bacterium]
MSEIQFVDTTLRDGQQSLWALGMRTGAMVAIAGQMDKAGFESMEFFVSIMIKKYIREHKENPWLWLREGTKRFRQTRLRLHGGMHGSGSFEKLPKAVMKLLIERVVAHGITLTRTSECWNDFQSFKKELHDLREIGMETIVNLIYSVSPRHTDEYYAEKAKEAAAIRPYRICFKDVGGLLTPERARTLIPVILDNAGDIPVEFHAHCNNGLAPICYLEAVKLGIKALHTSIPPLANGPSQPSIFNLARNLRALGYTPVLHEKELKPVEEHFTAVAKRDRLPIGEPLAYDYSQYLHQVPGGMISNLRHQLRVVGMEDKLEATLEEAAHVRAEFGYPIMVTPLSQFVASQAAINVIVGERYREVTDQVIQYALGLWGKEAPALMDSAVKDRILSRSRAKEYQDWEPPDPSLKEVRSRFGGPSVSDEELILRVYAGQEYVKAMHAAGPPGEYLGSKHSLVRLIEELSRNKDCRQISIRKPGLSLTLEKRTTSPSISSAMDKAEKKAVTEEYP